MPLPARGRARGSFASLTARMSTQPGPQDGETSAVMERHSHPTHKTLAGSYKPPACLGLSSLDPASQQQLSHSRGKIILSHKSAITAKILIDYQICVLQNSAMEAGQAVLQV